MQPPQQTQQSQVQPPQIKRPVNTGANKRTEVFLELRKFYEGLKAKFNSFSSRAAEDESLVEQIVEVHTKLSGFCQRIGLLLSEGDNNGQFSTDHKFKAAVGEFTNRLRRYKQ